MTALGSWLPLVACWNARGVVVGVASTGAEAVERATELRPDVALLDIDLGGESGFDVARRLSGEATLARTRMILIFTHAEQDYTDLIAASPVVGFCRSRGCRARRFGR
ncbi:MAG TPA: response regulator [Pseudonocardiaceae bacterium]|nr:response regulator [Pseudonocardiaceae bacterium]